ncbi:MAG: DEAD/DEAH box helicase, partial [Desulfobacterales bacterium]|nr:DEAD/DEAH box helicase [Desulfobacterales bacterium]
TTGEHAISVDGIVHSGGKKTDPENLLDAYLSEQPWFDLPNGACAFIPGRLSRELDRLSLRGDFRDDDIRFEHWDFSFLAAVFQNKDGKAERLPGDEVYHAYISFLNKMQDATGHPPVLATLEARLRPYQKIGYAWLTGLIQHGFGGILADDMGLGKTIQVLALLLHLKEKGRQSKSMSTTLLIVPKTLIWNWESEIKRFAPSLSTTIHTGPARDKHFSGCPTSDLVITSYGIVRRDIDALRRISWDLLILDEAQAVKNPDAQISKSVRRLNASNRLALTGTPIENRPLDLWSLFDFLMPGFLGDKTSFQDTYARQSTDALNLLGSLTAPFILRRMKSQVCTELPKKTEITQFCGFNEEQRQYYDDLMNRARDWLTGDNQPIQLLTLLLRLRQAACHPALVSGADVYRGSSGKFDAMIETAANILEGGHKILIFSQFVSLLDLVKQELETRGMPYYELYGSTRQREKVVQRFKRSDAPCVFLISLKAGGVGLNLTEAGYVFLLDPWWNPAVENQAIDRSYRIGQENPVTVYRFITKDSVEEKVNRLKERKRRVGETVLDHGEFKDTPFSTEELRMLIS